MIKLVEAEKIYLKEYQEAYEISLEKLEQGLMKKHNLMFVNINDVDIVQKFKDNRDKNKLPEGYVPSYDYFAVDEDKFIGVVHIRIRLTDNLLKYGGHIGYAVNPKYWKMGYGKQILKLALQQHKDLIEENKIENEDCGEKFLTRRYWIKK